MSHQIFFSQRVDTTPLTINGHQTQDMKTSGSHSRDSHKKSGLHRSQTKKIEHMEITPLIEQLADELISCSQYRAADGGMTLLPEEIKYEKFPPQLTEFVELLPGNHQCPDCTARRVKMVNNCLTWANVTFGTLICEECAFHHIHFRKNATVLSLHTGSWTLHQVLAVLKGGNQKMLKALVAGSKEPVSIEMRYASREAAAYQRFLTTQALRLCRDMTTSADISTRNKGIKNKQHSPAIPDQDPFDILSRNGERFNSHVTDRPSEDEMTISSKSTRQIPIEERTKFDLQHHSTKRRQQVSHTVGSHGKGAQGLLQLAMKSNIPKAQLQANRKNHHNGEENVVKRSHHQTERRERAGPPSDDDDRYAPVVAHGTDQRPTNGIRSGRQELECCGREADTKNKFLREQLIEKFKRDSNKIQRNLNHRHLPKNRYSHEEGSFGVRNADKARIAECANEDLTNPQSSDNVKIPGIKGPVGHHTHSVDTNKMLRRSSNDVDNRGGFGHPTHSIDTNKMHRRSSNDVDNRGAFGHPTHSIDTDKMHRRSSNGVDNRGAFGHPTHSIDTNKMHRRSSNDEDKRGASGRSMPVTSDISTMHRRSSNHAGTTCNEGALGPPTHHDIDTNKMHRRSSNHAGTGALGPPTYPDVDTNKMHTQGSNHAGTNNNEGTLGPPTHHDIGTTKMNRRSSTHAGTTSNEGTLGPPTHHDIGKTKMNRRSSNYSGTTNNEGTLGPPYHPDIGKTKMNRRSSNYSGTTNNEGALPIHAIDKNAHARSNDSKRLQRRSSIASRNFNGRKKLSSVASSKKGPLYEPTNNQEVDRMISKDSAATNEKGRLDRTTHIKHFNRMKRQGSVAVYNSGPLDQVTHVDDSKKMKGRSWADAYNRGSLNQSSHPYDADREEGQSLTSSYTRGPRDQPAHVISKSHDRIKRRSSVAVDLSSPLLQPLRPDKASRMQQQTPENEEHSVKASNVSYNKAPRSFNTKPAETEVTKQNEQELATAALKPRLFSRGKSLKSVSSLHHGGPNDQSAASRTNPDGPIKSIKRRLTRMNKQVAESKITGEGLDIDTTVFPSIRSLETNATETTVSLKAMGDALLANPDPIRDATPNSPAAKTGLDAPSLMNIGNEGHNMLKRGSMDTDLTLLNSNTTSANVSRAMIKKSLNSELEVPNNTAPSSREDSQTVIDSNSNIMMRQEDIPLDSFLAEKSIHSKWSSMDTLAPSSRANSIRFSRHVPIEYDGIISENSSSRSKSSSVDIPVASIVEDQIVTEDKKENEHCQNIPFDKNWSSMETLTTEVCESQATNDNNGHGGSDHNSCNKYVEGSLHSKWSSMDSMAPAVLTTMSKIDKVNSNMQNDRFLPGSHGTSMFWTDGELNANRAQPQDELSNVPAANSSNNNGPVDQIGAKSSDNPNSNASIKSSVSVNPSSSNISSRSDPIQHNYEEMRSYLQQIKAGRSGAINMAKRRPSSISDIVSKKIQSAHIMPGPFY